MNKLTSSDIQKFTCRFRLFFFLLLAYMFSLCNVKVHMWKYIQVILFEIDYAILYTNLYELFCQFKSWTNWVNSGKFILDNCWISCQVMAGMKKKLQDLIINYSPLTDKVQNRTYIQWLWVLWLILLPDRRMGRFPFLESLFSFRVSVSWFPNYPVHIIIIIIYIHKM